MSRKVMLEVEIKNILTYLHEDLYWSGPLGAEMVYFHNKCVTADKILQTFKQEDQFDRNMKRINKMINTAREDDYSILVELKELFEEYYKKINFGIRIPYLIKYNILEVNREFERFKSFCDNQNCYDNMISIIKIFNRLKMNKKDLKLNGEFNGDETDFEFFENDIKYQILKDLEGIRFTL